MIRDAGLSDLPAVLRLNAEWEKVTSRLDEGALVRLHEQAAYHRVFDIDSRVAAFLLALGPGATCESPNYRWFDDRLDRFLYIDRVIVSADFHRGGLAGELYADLIAHALSEGVDPLACEVDVEPLNVASDTLHARLGFVEVGTQVVADGSKRVSLRELVLRV